VIPKLAWSQILAYAWMTPAVLTDLKKDPKETVLELAKGTSGKYTTVDNDTKKAAETIKKQAATPIGGSYRGYLPIPLASEVGAIAHLGIFELTDLLKQGIAGILQFHDPSDKNQASLWAEELYEVWHDSDYLELVIQDPAKNLKNRTKLKSLFPMPDRPKALKTLDIEQLHDFFGDQTDMPHLSGIFLFAS
jgi:hypothetical protein